MKLTVTKSLFGFAAAAGLLFLAQSVAFAGTMSGTCNECHTMHNSQDGTNMGLLTAQNQLLLNTCFGCHTGDVGTMLSDQLAPIVLHTSEPNSDPTGVGGNDYLAGGSFYWVAIAGDRDSTKGHNIDVMADLDTEIGINPPGGAGGWSTQLTCDGATGCHTASGVHHLNEGGDRSAPQTSVWVANVAAAKYDSYRFLSTGVDGAENGDWEYTSSPQDHNVYFEIDQYDHAADNTMSGFCANCHGNFHGRESDGAGAGTSANNDGVTPWIRHPTAISLNSAALGTTEYTGYVSYDPIVPVAVDDPTTGTAGNPSFEDVVAGSDFVTCTSCHRAHGSPYADMLRWSYGLMDAGTSNASTLGGCFRCHTTK